MTEEKEKDILEDPEEELVEWIYQSATEELNAIHRGIRYDHPSLEDYDMNRVMDAIRLIVEGYVCRIQRHIKWEEDER